MDLLQRQVIVPEDVSGCEYIFICPYTYMVPTSAWLLWCRVWEAALRVEERLSRRFPTSIFDFEILSMSGCCCGCA